ncbi:MAG: DUF72 domain-containing protein [Lacunisphaera sp.]
MARCGAGELRQRTACSLRRRRTRPPWPPGSARPRSPVRFTALGKRPFLRFVGDPVVEKNRELLAEWAGHVARWIGEGRTPWFFAHHPDDLHAPAVARIFQQLLHERCRRCRRRRCGRWRGSARRGASNWGCFKDLPVILSAAKDPLSRHAP